MATAHNWNAFLRCLALTVAGGIVGAIGFVMLVDPYDLYHLFKRPGFNTVKPDLSRHADEIKLTHAVKLNPNIIILGNSRAEIGFDPESPALTRRGYSAYNLAIRGTSIETARRQLDYLLYRGIKPKTIVLGVDFIDFMAAPGTLTKGASPPTASSPPFAADKWFWRFDSLFSMASLKDALLTLSIQSNEEAAMMTSRGFNPLREYRNMARNEGYFALFQQRAKENAKTYLKKATGVIDMAEFRHVQAIADFAATSGSEIILIIYPYHSQILALFEETGLWTAFEQWKELLAAEVSAARLSHGDLRISLIDYSGYSPTQCESIPAKGDLESSPRGYWEAGHFKKELGDTVLEQALSLSAGTRPPADTEPGFGMRLDETSLALNRQRIAQERSACAGAYPQLFADVRTIVQLARSK